MFQKSRKRIVISIMSLLVLILVGTIGIIYITTYREIYRNNQELLIDFTENNMREGKLEPPVDEEQTDDGRKIIQIKQSVVFYGVIFHSDLSVNTVVNDLKPIMEDESLVTLAREILSLGKIDGIMDNFIYRVTRAEDGIYVVVIDNTLMRDSQTSLVKNTTIFGCIALVILLGVSIYIANRIVTPLEESYKKQKQFISDAGHELKTPISTIYANSEILQREIGENQWLSNIQFENHRMKELVEQLLELAKTEYVSPVLEQVDMSRIVLGGILPFESVAFEKGYLIESKVEERVDLLGDSKQLGQLVSILVDNALSHAQGEGAIIINLRRERNTILLSVSNPGKEIPLAEREHIFERFYRTDESRRLNGHYGLGLAIAKAIVQAHQGKIAVSCQEGMNTFQVIFPFMKNNT